MERRHHYIRDTDSPAWTRESGSSYTRLVGGLGGIAATWESVAAQPTWQLANLHGDVVASINSGDTGLSATYEATEYGIPRDSSDIGNHRYGWLGAKQRAADTPTGITLMGVRIYNSLTGRFLQVDPIFGGSCNAYDYVCADPVNKFDIDGRMWQWLVEQGLTILTNFIVGLFCTSTAVVGGPALVFACSAIAGAFMGALTSVAIQMLVEKKEFGEINWARLLQRLLPDCWEQLLARLDLWCVGG